MAGIQGHRPRQVAFDVGLLVGVPLLLAAIHYGVPAGLRRALAFDHAAPAPHAYLTAAYVHADAAHLHGNLLGYGLVVTYAYLLCLQADRRRWFHATFAAFLLALPVFVNLVDAAAFAVLFPGVALVSQGFSGVAAGFGGFLVVALVAYLRDAYDRGVAIRVGLVAALTLLLEVDVIYAGRLRPVTAGLVALGVGLAGWSHARERGLPWRRSSSPSPDSRADGGPGRESRLGAGRRDGSGPGVDAAAPGDGPGGDAVVAVDADAGAVGADRRRLVVDALEVAVVLGVLALQVAMLFPANPVVEGAFVGVFAHAAGFLLGLVGARGVAVALAVDG